MNNQDVEPHTDANRFDALKARALNREEKESVIKIALSVLAERHRAGRALSSPEQTRDFLRLKLSRSQTRGVRCAVPRQLSRQVHPGHFSVQIDDRLEASNGASSDCRRAKRRLSFLYALHRLYRERSARDYLRSHLFDLCHQLAARSRNCKP